MNQQFHVVMQGKKSIVRVPLPPGEKYDSKIYINPEYEVRQFLESIGPYAMASIEDLDKASKMIDYGYQHTDRSMWHVAGAYVRDGGAVFVLLPADKFRVSFYHDVGMKIDLATEKDSFKAGKYIKRLCHQPITLVMVK
jgi:hypothetical protein